MKLVLSIFLSWSSWCGASSADSSSGPVPPNVHYDAINVWPMPKHVTLCSSQGKLCQGPHTLASNVKVDLDDSCDARVSPLLKEALGGKTVTVFKGATRTYNEASYVAPDSFCSKACIADSDCGMRQSCFIPSDRRWSSKEACAPSAKFNTGCGCCTPVQGPPAIQTVSVVCSSAPAATSATAGEGYTLEITASAVTITAPTSQGAAYGLTTLAQLLRYDTDLGAGVLNFIPITIVDEPRFSWRGHMLDTSRHFIPTDEILKLLDGLHSAKLNTFHWHIVDSPSFPMESVLYPELSREGSWTGDNSTVYSRADQAAVATRARELFIELVMEIDTPAHTLAIGKSHPEMMADCWEWMANSGFKVDVDSDDCLAMDPTNPAARDMVRGILAEAAALQGKDTRFLHIGGDEVKFDCWKNDAAIAAHVTKTYGDTSPASFARLQAEWTANVSAMAVVRAGKRPVLWQPTTEGPGDPVWDQVLPKDSVYMVWLNSASAQAYASHGSAVVYTTPYYVAGMGSGGWTSVYNADIMPANLTAEQQENVLGGEVCMWGENLDASNLGVRAFQIGAAAAESFWRSHGKTDSGGPAAAGGLATSDRYNRFLCHLGRFGIDAAPVMPSSCAVRTS